MTEEKLDKVSFYIRSDFGKKDDILPYKAAELLKSKIHNCQLWLPEDGNHSNLENLPEYGSKTFSFLQENGLL